MKLILVFGLLLNSVSPGKPSRVPNLEVSSPHPVEVSLGGPVQEVKGYQWRKEANQKWERLALIPGDFSVTVRLPGGESYTGYSRSLVMLGVRGRVAQVSLVPFTEPITYAEAGGEVGDFAKVLDLPAKDRKEMGVTDGPLLGNP